MTKIKAKALEMIERLPDEKMIYVINILQNIEALSLTNESEKMKSMTALQNLLKFEKKLPVDFDAEKELADAREEKYGNLS